MRSALGYATAAALAALTGACSRESPPLPRLGAVADFALLDQRGKPATRARLAGRPWIADFVFTRCSGPCPRLSEEMARLAKDLPAAIRLVSFSVDPEWDTPEVLASYARAFEADPERWLFLTGEKRALYELAVGSFKVPVQEAPGGDPGTAVIHTQKFVLVDGETRIRGYYDGNDREDLERLRRDARALAGRAGR